MCVLVLQPYLPVAVCLASVPVPHPLPQIFSCTGQFHLPFSPSRQRSSGFRLLPLPALLAPLSQNRSLIFIVGTEVTSPASDVNFLHNFLSPSNRVRDCT